MIFSIRHALGRRAALRSMERIGAVHFSSENKTVRIRYIVDFVPNDSRLRGEAGVSYLIQTEHHNVLFDLGFNHGKENPSLLASNLHAMKLEHQKLDGIVISHNHLDHVGGFKCQRRKTPDINQFFPETLEGSTVWTPVPMNTDPFKNVTVTEPIELFPGLASTGPLPAHMYFMGSVKEQALLIPVTGKGLILVTGCGHPEIVEMVRASNRITGMKVFAVVGGLHLMCSAGRSRLQKFIGATDAPWAGKGEEGIRQIAEELLYMGVRQIAPSAHDTCDVALGILRDTFSDGYLEVKAGAEHVFAADG